MSSACQPGTRDGIAPQGAAMSRQGPWTSDVQAWYEQWVDRLVDKLKTYRFQGPEGKPDGPLAYTDELLPWVWKWYAERGPQFCKWVERLEEDYEPGSAYDTYNYNDFWRDRPCWRIQWEKLLDARSEARDGAQAALRTAAEAATFATLDDWLTMALAGKLTHDGPEESGGYSLSNRLPRDARERFLAHAHYVRLYWPRLCRTCGEEFHPDPAGNHVLVNCPACRARRSERLNKRGATT